MFATYEILKNVILRMKIIFTTLFLFECLLCSAQIDPANNKLFGAGKISITSNNKILPNLTNDRDSEIGKLLRTNFTSGTIYFTGEGFEPPKKISTNDRKSLRKELKKCKTGTVLVLIDCVVDGDNVKSNEPFNQIVSLN